MAASIKERFPAIETELIKGSKGIFDVTLDGQLIFSKYEVDRFPEGDEVLTEIEKLQKA